MPEQQSGQIFSFDRQSLEDWQERSFKGNTEYNLVNLAGEDVLEARADGTASLLFRQQNVSLESTPRVRWRWRIEDTLANEGSASIDETSKQGDDYPARFYVAVQTGLSPWETVAINYVWSSSAAVGASWTNPFSKRAKMLVLQSGADKKLEWITETRDLREDFRRLHGIDVDSISGFAVMVDGDNTGLAGRAWFGDIEFLPDS